MAEHPARVMQTPEIGTGLTKTTFILPIIHTQAA